MTPPTPKEEEPPLVEDEQPESAEALATPETRAESLPTHRLRNIKLGNKGVQFFVSSRNYLYDIDTMEGGEGSWQAVGAWEDPTIVEGIRTLRERQAAGNSPPAGDNAQQRGPNSYSGSGQKLGKAPSATSRHGMGAE